MNNVVLSGRLTVVPEVKFTKSGKEVVNASIAVNRNRKDANGERIVDFFDFTVWGQAAQYLAKFADKGADGPNYLTGAPVDIPEDGIPF